MLQEDKLEPSEQLGDLLKQAGDADAALKCYRSSGATTKVIEGEVNHKHQSCPVTHTGLSHLAQPTDSHACVVSYVLHLPLSYLHVLLQDYHGQLQYYHGQHESMSSISQRHCNTDWTNWPPSCFVCNTKIGWTASVAGNVWSNLSLGDDIVFIGSTES